MDEYAETYSTALKQQGLSEESHSENALLRSRIDEQSRLIMILKQHSDESLLASKAADKRYVSMEAERLQLTQDLELMNKRCSMLDARFNDLAANHQQMIEFKDEYKRLNAELLVDNDKLRSENTSLFSSAVEECNAKINQLLNTNSDLIKEKAAAEEKLRQSQIKLENNESDNRLEISRLQSDLEAKDKLLRTTKIDLKSCRNLIHEQTVDEVNSKAKVQNELEKLTRERDNFSELSMSRGRIIQEKQLEIGDLQKKLEAAEKTVDDLKMKQRRDAVVTSVDKEVIRLKKCLTDEQLKYQALVQEFDVFKQYSMSLLQQEKKLNEQLRHLSS